MAKVVLESIKRLDPPFDPEPGWERMGMTPQGFQLWKSTEKRSRSEPDIDEETGKQKMQLHPQNAQPLYPLRKAVVYDLVRTFYMESEGNGQITKVDWSPQTEAEATAAVREKKIAGLMPTMAEEMVDAGITPEAMADALRMVIAASKQMKADGEPEEIPVEARPTVSVEDFSPKPSMEQPSAEVAESVIPAESFPFQYSQGRWRLSNGNQINAESQEVAEAAEAALHEDVGAKEEELPVPEGVPSG